MGMIIFGILLVFSVCAVPGLLDPSNLFGFGFIFFALLFGFLSFILEKREDKYNKKVKPEKIKRWKELVDKELDIAYGMSTEEIKEKVDLEIELNVHSDAFFACNELEPRYWNYLHGVYEFWNHLDPMHESFRPDV